MVYVLRAQLIQNRKKKVKVCYAASKSTEPITRGCRIELGFFFFDLPIFFVFSRQWARALNCAVNFIKRNGTATTSNNDEETNWLCSTQMTLMRALSLSFFSNKRLFSFSFFALFPPSVSFGSENVFHNEITNIALVWAEIFTLFVYSSSIDWIFCSFFFFLLISGDSHFHTITSLNKRNVFSFLFIWVDFFDNLSWFQTDGIL